MKTNQFNKFLNVFSTIYRHMLTQIVYCKIQTGGVWGHSFLALQIPEKTKLASLPESPRNCATPLGNSKAKNKDPWNSTWLFLSHMGFFYQVYLRNSMRDLQGLIKNGIEPLRVINKESCEVFRGIGFWL